jgi:hypothetical protein
MQLPDLRFSTQDSMIPTFHYSISKTNPEILKKGCILNLFRNSEAKSYLDLSSLFFFFFRGRFTPNVPLFILPRFVFLSPLPKADPSSFKGNVKN